MELSGGWSMGSSCHVAPFPQRVVRIHQSEQPPRVLSSPLILLLRFWLTALTEQAVTTQSFPKIGCPSGGYPGTLVLGYKLPFLSFYQERFNIKYMCAVYIFTDACIYFKMMFPLVYCQKPWLLQEVVFDCNCLKVQKSNSLYLQIQKRILPVPLKEAERNECLYLSPPGFEWAL